MTANENARLAALIFFKSDVTFEEAVAALRSIKGVLDNTKGVDAVTGEDIPARCKDVVRKYNPEYGHPTFYIP